MFPNPQYPLTRADLKRGRIYTSLFRFSVHPDRGITPNGSGEKEFPTIRGVGHEHAFMVLVDPCNHVVYYSDYHLVGVMSTKDPIVGWAMIADHDRFSEVTDE